MGWNFRPRLVLTVLSLAAAGQIARADPTPPDATWPAHGNTVLHLAFSPDGTRLATVGDDNKFKLFDVTTHKELGAVADTLSNSNQVHFTPDGKTVFTLGMNDSLAVLDGVTGQAKPPLALHSVPGGTRCFDVS